MSADPKPSPKSIWVVSALVILVAVLAVLGVLFIVQKPNLAQYRIAIALLCFALSTVSALLFPATAEVYGKLATVGIKLAGPAAVWVVTLILFNHFIPEKDLGLIDTPLTIEKLDQLAADAASKEGWKTFEDWRNDLGPLQDVFRRDEEFHLEQLFGSVFYRGSRKKLFDPTWQSLIAYCQDGAVWLLRISGVNKSGVANIYFSGGTPSRNLSLPGSEITSALLVKGANDRIVGSYTESGETWREIYDDRPDCLIITVFGKEDTPSSGDYLILDVPKYLQDGDTTIDLGIVAWRQINGSSLTHWTMRGGRVSVGSASKGDTPLVFKRLSAKAEASIDSMQQGLVPWLSLIDETIDKRPNEVSANALAVLNQALEILPHTQSSSAKFSTFLKDTTFKSRFSSHIGGLQDPMVTTFLWQ